MFNDIFLKDIFFKSEEHKQRFLDAIIGLGKVYSGQLDPEYAAALYIFTSDLGTWQMVRRYVSRHGIDIQRLLDEEHFSSSEAVLTKLAGNLFNNQQHLDPLEFLRLDDRNFQIALTALILRRSRFHVNDFDYPAANETSVEPKTV
jgi:hypothetical protein